MEFHGPGHFRVWHKAEVVDNPLLFLNGHFESHAFAVCPHLGRNLHLELRQTILCP
jgi:hypothetical protein